MQKFNYILLLAVVFLTACDKAPARRTPVVKDESFNGIYFWRTTFDVSAKERAFLKEHEIDRLYLRLFDVDVAQQNLLESSQPTPIATIIFTDSVATAKTISLVRDIVPVAFITLPALKGMRYAEKEYAWKLVTRMLNMSSYHQFRDKVTEIQIDCDWTPSTEHIYFALLGEIKELLKKEQIMLSVTIRLHQLRTAPPPVDKGVLMVYNTGSIKEPKTINSILTVEDAAQYLSHNSVEKYKLSLDYAFPTFSWGVWFRCNQYLGILHRDNYENPHYYSMIDSTHFEVLHPHVIEERCLQKGDIIRLEKSDYETIIKTKSLLPFGGNRHSIILYHLDANKLKDYESEKIDYLYCHSDRN